MGRDYCENLDEIMLLETKVIRKHLAEHKYLRHIADDNVAKLDFIKMYAQLIREIYCGVACNKKEGCLLHEKYKYLEG